MAPVDLKKILQLTENLGLCVIPLLRAEKIPAVSWKRVINGRPFTREELVAMWETRFNPGIACGPSDIVVVDADNQGAIDWVAEHLPATPVQTLTRAGRHYVYRRPPRDVVEKISNRSDVLGSKKKWAHEAREKWGLDIYLSQDRDQTEAQLAAERERVANAKQLAEDKVPLGPVIDVRGDGGQVVAPGAIHPSGHVYAQAEPWTPELFAAMPVYDPAWFEGRKWRRPSVGRVSDLQARRRERALGAARDQDPTTKVKRARAWLEPVEGAVSGAGGHNKLFYAACRLVQGFDVDVDEAFSILKEDYNPRCQPAWNDEELAHKVVDAENTTGGNRGYMLVDRPDFRPKVHEIREFEADLDTIEAQMTGEAPPRPYTSDDGDEGLDLEDGDEHAPRTGAIESVNAADLTDDDRYWIKRWLEPFGVNFLELVRDQVQFNRKSLNGAAWSLPPTLVNITTVLRYSRLFKGHLRFNELKSQYEYRGRVLGSHDVTEIVYRLGEIWNGNVNKDHVRDALSLAAEKYEPVGEWLESLPAWDGTERLIHVPRDLLKTPDAKPVHGQMFRHFMVGLVARNMRPGAKVDTIHFLVGPQGAYKSQFWCLLIDGDLYANNWFTDESFKLDDKDGKMLISSHVVVEWSEGEHAKSGKMIDKVKQFLSQKTDDYRSPYAADVVKRPRRCVFVGTSNDDELIHDSSGDRRFYITRTGPKIDLPGLLRQRDQLFAEALSIWRRHDASEFEDAEYNATRWWFTQDEDSERARAVAQFRSRSAWYEDIENWLEARRVSEQPMFTIAQVVEGCLDMPKDRKSKRVQSEVKATLIQLGCIYQGQKRVTMPGELTSRKGRFWIPPPPSSN